jgi:hypothetical protein
VLAEFNPALGIISANLHEKYETFNLADLLPRAKTGILNTPLSMFHVEKRIKKK